MAAQAKAGAACRRSPTGAAMCTGCVYVCVSEYPEVLLKQIRAYDQRPLELHLPRPSMLLSKDPEARRIHEECPILDSNTFGGGYSPSADLFFLGSAQGSVKRSLAVMSESC